MEQSTLVRPTLEMVRQTFKTHHEHWRTQTGVNADMQSGTEEKVTQQYAGRTPFELLQNALDRCRRHVWISVVDEGCHGSLFVGNDGSRVSVAPCFNPRRSISWNREQNLHSDFHALCAVNLSNKDPDESTGNKGVGFRAVFELGRRVQVWSRLMDGGWWGLELHRSISRLIWERRRCADPQVWAGLEAFLEVSEPWIQEGECLASFFAPLPLRAERPFAALPSVAERVDRTDTQTVVVVPVKDEGARRGLDRGLEALGRRHLDFIGLRESRREVSVALPGELALCRTWPQEGDGTLLLRHMFPRGGDLAQRAEKAGLAVQSVGVAVRWPGQVPGFVERSEATTSRQIPVNEHTRTYCYLPTQVRGAFAADIHGDFQLGIDRKTLNVEDEPVALYHVPLLRAVAELHVGAALRACGLSAAEVSEWPGLEDAATGELLAGEHVVRDDVWMLLCPTGQELPPVLNRVRELLFDASQKHGDHSPGYWTRWARLARRFFGSPDALHTRIVASHEAFWAATEAWLGLRVDGYSSRAKARRSIPDALLQALHETKACVIPILRGGEALSDECRSTTVPLRRPQGGAQQAAELRLFLPRSKAEPEIPPLPSSLRRHGVVLSVWRPGHRLSERDGLLPGASPFTPPELLAQIRQLPRSVSEDWEPAGPLCPAGGDDGAEDSTREQEELIRYAARLFLTPFDRGRRTLASEGSAYVAGWRVLRDQGRDVELAAGSALSTLFLRNRDETWEPARQLQRDELHADLLASLSEVLGSDAARGEFLDFIGVARPGGLRLVEGGAQGWVRLQPTPPALVRPDNTPERPLKVVFQEPHIPAGATPEEVLVAWGDDDNPGPLRRLTDPELSMELGARCGVRRQLSTVEWLPVGEGEWVRPPQGLVSKRAHVCPAGVALFPSQGGEQRLRRVLWSWRRARDAAERNAIGLLQRLGAVSVTDTLTVKGARQWLQTMRNDIDLATLLREAPDNRTALLLAYQRVMEVLGREPGELVDLLVFVPERSAASPDSGVFMRLGPALGQRRLAWFSHQRQAWVASERADQAILARHYPQLPLVAVTLGRQLHEGGPLRGRRISLHTAVKQLGAGVPDDGRALLVAWRLTDVLPHLLALADVSPRLARPVSSVSDFPQRARQLVGGHLCWARDVYIDYTITRGPDGVSGLPWRKGTYDDVFLEGNTKENAGTIWFDAELSHPPLHFFGEALARFMGLGEVADTWSLALAALDNAESPEEGRRRLDDLLVRKGGSVESLQKYRRLIRPLSAEQLGRIRSAVIEGLAALGLAPAGGRPRLTGSLRPGDLQVQDERRRSVWTEENIRRMILKHLSDPTLKDELPAVSFRGVHADTWTRWLDSVPERRRPRLLRWVSEALDERAVDDERPVDAHRARRLQIAHEQLSGCLDFRPEEAARRWLSAELADSGREVPATPIDAWLPEHRIYEPITAPPIALETAPIPLAFSTGDVPELAPQSDDEREASRIRTAERGHDAEEAMLQWVAKTTRGHVEGHGEDAWRRLLGAVPEGGRVHRALLRCQEQGELTADALHVSNLWGNAGYDLLGLDVREGKLVAARYEVKGLPRGARRLRFFLSRNELGVARRCRASRDVWRLVGVQEGGCCLDLTPIVEELLDLDDGVLRRLNDLGIAADGFVCQRTLPG